MIAAKKRTRLSDRLRKRPPVARDRDGCVLSVDLSAMLTAHIQPAQRRILMVLVSEEGRVFGFDELTKLASVGSLMGSTSDRADRLHRHIHYIRQALVPDCWIDSVMRAGYVFHRRHS